MLTLQEFEGSQRNQFEYQHFILKLSFDHLASEADTVKLPVVVDVFPPVCWAEQVGVVVVVWGHDLLTPGDGHQGLADVGEVLPRDDLDVRHAAVRQQARPGI